MHTCGACEWKGTFGVLKCRRGIRGEQAQLRQVKQQEQVAGQEIDKIRQTSWQNIQGKGSGRAKATTLYLTADIREIHECDCTAWLFELHVFRSMNERGQWQHLVKFQDDISLNMLQQLSVLCPNFFVNGALLFFLAQGNLQDLYECPSTSVWIKNF